MEFRVDRFYRINRRVLIWAAIIALLYILRDFFALIFITFLVVSFTLPAIEYFQRNSRLPRPLIIVVLYLFILAGLSGLIYYITPRLTAEATGAAAELTAIQSRILGIKDDLKHKYPSLAPILDEYIERDQLQGYLDLARQKAGPVLATSAKFVFKAVTTILLALLFSFLIVVDLTRLTDEVRRLRASRLRDFYEETAKPVVRFASVLARAFRAQAMIAVANALLTMLGLIILGLPKVALLTIIVFFFSFIPVLGVFISTIPAVLVAINYSGDEKALAVIVLVTIIHIIEAYGLNPIIYGRQLKLNPVLVLIILFVGHHFFGIWGMILGVPVSYYFLFYVFNVPKPDGGYHLPDTDSGQSTQRVDKDQNTPIC
ncbi:MAG: AI-2E family transporter [bacterium]|nr:AI-2E family transporter [Candidatus Sumerlaeota bacterium]